VTAGGAARRLVKAGFKKVYTLEGGNAAWQQASLPMVKGKA
jgi:rhodanese-related sulfurtransferase